jgi:branched-chain amino acid transport system ATP-binding protein
VKGVDLEVNPGELVCLIGANGAGKTTTLKAITGLVRAASGRIQYDGAEISGFRVHEIARRGLALVPEGRGVFAQLTIEENLAMGAYARNDRPAVAADLERAFTLFPRLKERRAQTAGTLSGGEQQMLAIARALMSKPKLLLDEPSMGLAPTPHGRAHSVRGISAEGVTMLLVEQNAPSHRDQPPRLRALEGGLVTISGEARSPLEIRESARRISGMSPLRALAVITDLTGSLTQPPRLGECGSHDCRRLPRTLPILVGVVFLPLAFLFVKTQSAVTRDAQALAPCAAEDMDSG